MAQLAGVALQTDLEHAGRAIQRRHVLAVLDPIWKKIPVMASEVRARIHTILASAKARGLRSGDNPAAWDDGMEADLGKPPKRGETRGPMASVPFKELPALIAELDSKKIATARALIHRHDLRENAGVPLYAIERARP